MIIALQDTAITHALDGRVEIIEALPADRRFPTRVSKTFGLCVKTGPSHDVTVGGRRIAYPADALCIRMPGCVWSSASTGDVGFLSVDIDEALLPAESVSPEGMTFWTREQLPDMRAFIRDLQVGGARADEAVIEMLIAVSLLGVPIGGDIHASAVARLSRRVRDTLNDTLAEPRSLTEMAEHLGVSRFALLRRFKRDFGVTPHAYLVQRRVEEAKRLLRQGREIADVAHELGFADQSHLTRVFRRAVGMPPGAYATGVRRTFVQDIRFPRR